MPKPPIETSGHDPEKGHTILPDVPTAEAGGANAVPPELLELLRCPIDGTRLERGNGELIAQGDGRRFGITTSGIPLLAGEPSLPESRVQQAHYDKIAEAYFRNLALPHTRTYMDYLDRALIAAVNQRPLGNAAEICCGNGESFKLLGRSMQIGVGVDISVKMLEMGRREIPVRNVHFVQGDATALPLADAAFDSVFMLGGIHHISDRNKLFGEVHRILKPGGHFYFREPLNDFALWRLLRYIIYRISPTLDHRTERPLRWRETVPVLEAAGLTCELWQPAGLLGFCLFMNSDVLVVNRLFRFIPGIQSIVRAFCRLDEAMLRIPLLKSTGLQVVGVAAKALQHS